MLLKVIQAGDRILREPSRLVSDAELQSERVQSLIDLMIATLRDAPGVGIATVQVGEALQIIVIEDRAEYHKALTKAVLQEQGRRSVPLQILINPKLDLLGDDWTVYPEACLSVPGYRGMVRRSKRVLVTALDRSGKPVTVAADGWFARILQHECDHLEGELYLRKVLPGSNIAEKYYMNYWKDQPEATILATFGSASVNT